VKTPKEIPAALRKALRYGSPALFEKFLKGPEITVGILGDQALPILEIVPADRAFYDFHAKYAPGGSSHLYPARISAAHARRARELAQAACRVLGIRAVGRVDLIVDARRGPSLLEVNTIPGMTETSLLPDAARHVGISFDALVLRIMELSVGPT
jgi:D-alanine-D-alanine ligase